MHVLQTFEDLVDDVLLMDIFENVGSDNSVQVSLHKVKNQVNISVVLSNY
jgi:hypothetical protein